MTTNAEFGRAVATVLSSVIFFAFALRLHWFVGAFTAEDADLVNAVAGKLHRGDDVVYHHFIFSFYF